MATNQFLVCPTCGRSKRHKYQFANDNESKLNGLKNPIKSPEYRSWVGMRARCYNPKSPSYHRYGGRGITVCERWRFSFENFYEDMGPKPDGTSLDRIDVDGDYDLDNCRWATDSQQARNKTNTLYVEIDGEKITVADLSESSGIPYNTLKKRVRKGYSTERLLEPLNLSKVRKYEYKGKLLSLREVSEMSGHSVGVVKHRIEKMGKSVEDLIDNPEESFQIIRSNESDLHIDYNGKEVTVLELSKLTGLHTGVIYDRIKRGLNISEICEPVYQDTVKHAYKGGFYTLIEISKMTQTNLPTLRYRVEKLRATVEEALDPNYRAIFNRKLHEYNGEMLMLSEISIKTGLDIRLLWQRAKNGSHGIDLVAPVKSPQKYTYYGNEYTLMQLARLRNIPPTTLKTRLKKMSVEDAVEFSTVSEVSVNCMKRDANVRGEALPCDQVKIIDPKDPEKFTLVNPLGWEGYDT